MVRQVDGVIGARKSGVEAYDRTVPWKLGMKISGGSEWLVIERLAEDSCDGDAAAVAPGEVVLRARWKSSTVIAGRAACAVAVGANASTMRAMTIMLKAKAVA